MEFDIRYFDSLSSTMNVAREEALHGAFEGLLVQAGMQTEGRGRRGNHWSSPFGNIYQSIVLRPDVERQNWGQLSFVIAVALAQACFEVGVDRERLNLKWPNDVLLDEKKLGGVLIEAADKFVIVGIGVNIVNAPEDRSKIHDYCDVSRNDFRDIFLNHLKHYYKQWVEKGFVDIRTEWMKHAYKLNDVIRARLTHKEYNGIFKDLSLDGTLILEEEDGEIRQINSGEIFACSSP